MWIGCLNNKKFCFNFPFAIWDVIPCADIDFCITANSEQRPENSRKGCFQDQWAIKDQSNSF